MLLLLLLTLYPVGRSTDTQFSTFNAAITMAMAMAMAMAMPLTMTMVVGAGHGREDGNATADAAAVGMIASNYFIISSQIKIYFRSFRMYRANTTYSSQRRTVRGTDIDYTVPVFYHHQYIGAIGSDLHWRIKVEWVTDFIFTFFFVLYFVFRISRIKTVVFFLPVFSAYLRFGVEAE